MEITNKFSLDAGLRMDYFRFIYRNALLQREDLQRQDRAILCPKMNLQYNASRIVKLYLNTGIGFHSNDTRVILNQAAKDILPRVMGVDFGVVLTPVSSMIIKMVAWQLHSQQEFIYVGDAGIVEPGGRTIRMGIDLSLRQQLRPWLFADVDMNFTRAKLPDNAKGQDDVPLAPSFTSMGGLTATLKHGFSSSLRYRFMDDRPASEDYSSRADGYFLMDLITSMRRGKWTLTVSMENIGNVEWREAQFNTSSRLQNELLPVTEIHFTPGIPRFIKAGIQYEF